MLGLLGAAGGGGMSASGEISTKTSSGGSQGPVAFGAINFGSGASVGGASAAQGMGQDNVVVYVALGVLALILLFRR